MVEEKNTKSSEKSRIKTLKNKVLNNKRVNGVVEVVTKTTKQIINFVLIGVLIVVSFFIGYFYSDIEPVILNKKKNFSEIKNRTNTSISVTEKGELMIIDRDEQKIQIYDDTIASIIFNSYSNRMINSHKKTK